MTNRERILRILSNHPKGLGYNELKRKVYEKSLRRWLPILLRDELIRIENPIVRGGRKNLHIITRKGKEYLKRSKIIYQLEKFIEEFDKLSKMDRVEAFSKIFRDMFESFVWYGSLHDIRKFHDAIESRVKDFLNNDLFDLKKKEMVNLFKSNSMKERGVGAWYHDPFYGIRVVSIGFLLKDSKLAWELGHYLNRHHVYLLTRLGILSHKQIKHRNKKWLEEHKLSRENDVEKEIRERIELFKRQFPEWINLIPLDYGNFIRDIR